MLSHGSRCGPQSREHLCSHISSELRLLCSRRAGQVTRFVPSLRVRTQGQTSGSQLALKVFALRVSKIPPTNMKEGLLCELLPLPLKQSILSLS